MYPQSCARLLLVIGLCGWAQLALAGNHAPNPYQVLEDWAQLPDGRQWGAVSAIYPARDGKHIWVAERCGANSCVDSKLDPILLFRQDGSFVRSFGAGLFAWPHGIHVDREGHVWVTDALGYAKAPPGWGHVVYKFSARGELLMTLGKKGEAGGGRHRFRKPSDVLVAPNGDIFVADGHGSSPGEPVNNRIVKFAPDGSFLLAWGKAGDGRGEFQDAHALAMDSKGRLFVGDRGNNRIQIFDQQGRQLASWTQFGRPSGLFIDEHDILYSADSESNAERNPGWKRGIRIGSAATGFVTAFIPDPEPNQDASATSAAEGVAVDRDGNIHGAEVGPRSVRKYVRSR